MTLRKKIIMNYFFTFFLIALSASSFARAFDFDPGGGSNGDGNQDLTAPYIVITPDSDFACFKTQVKIQTYDFGSGVKTIKLFIDGSLVKQTTGQDSLTYVWDTTFYEDQSTHTVRVYANDYAGNSRTRERSYIIGYRETTQHYKYPYGRTGDYDEDLGVIAYTKIESDLFVIIMLVTADSILAKGGDRGCVLVCRYSVTTIYYCKDEHRMEYNLDPPQRPIEAPHGTLVELNFEMEETNTNLADYSFGEVRHYWDDDQVFWPQFSTPDYVALQDGTKKVIKRTIDALAGYVGLSKIGKFAVSKLTSFILDKTFNARDEPFSTLLEGAEPVRLNYRNPIPAGQIVAYPDNNFNYAYDGISCHRIQFEYRNTTNTFGRTLGLKFRFVAQYADERSDIITDLVSNWVKVEFVLN